jgi:hypothetical protein
MEHFASENNPQNSPGRNLLPAGSEDSIDTPIQYTSFDEATSKRFDNVQIGLSESQSPISEEMDIFPLHAPTPARLQSLSVEEATPLVSNRSFLSHVRGIHRPASPSGTFPVESPKRMNRPSETKSLVDSEGDCSIEENTAVVPQHLMIDPNAKCVQYQIVYRGTVSLLATPSIQGTRNGSYLSYGDIFESSWCSTMHETISESEALQLKPRSDFEILQNQALHSGPPTMPSLQNHPTSEMNSAHAIIRVDRVLTRGYSINPSSQPMDYNGSKTSYGGQFSGFVVSHVGDQCIAKKLDTGPEIEERIILLKVTSSSPIPIFSGPSFDAPKLKAMALPGTTVEASLRIRLLDDTGEESGVSFLRLNHRHGWLADRRQGSDVPTVTEIPIHASGGGDCDESILSTASTMTSFSSSSYARRKHRPPRRRTDASIEAPALNISRINSEIGPSGTPERSSSFQDSSQCSKKLPSPVSNLSLLSDESSIDYNTSDLRHPQSPDVSHSTNRSTGSSKSKSTVCLYLMRVTSPRGLKILDTPHFQVNRLIRKNLNSSEIVSSSHTVSKMESGPPKKHHSIFHTMSGRTTTTSPSSRTGNPAIFDSGSRTRILPRGVLFEAASRVEQTVAFSDGEGLIKLSDNSGWAIIPHEGGVNDQYRSYEGQTIENRRAFEEVGNAVMHESVSLGDENRSTIWLRVEVRTGLPIACPPPVDNSNDGDTSPTSSRDSSSIGGSHAGSNVIVGQDSDVASSVGSTFIDSVFRTPGKNREAEERQGEVPKPLTHADIVSSLMSDSVACGTCVEVHKWFAANDGSPERQDYARLRGGQGWLPMYISGKVTSVTIPKPEFRFGSFWFRVKSSRGVKARQGPSRRAPSIRSEDGARVMRFECGEFLRASEIVTVFALDGKAMESFAKLFRNRHVQLYRGLEPFRPLVSLAAPAEWVPIFSSSEQFLEECTNAPRIERHKQGWRYNVVPETGVAVRKGPSFASETTGAVLLGGESVIVNERVTPGGETIAWLRLSDGQWVHDADDNGNKVMASHSLNHRSIPRPKREQTGTGTLDGKEAAYNRIVSRLFHGVNNEIPRSNAQQIDRKFLGR